MRGLPWPEEMLCWVLREIGPLPTTVGGAVPDVVPDGTAMHTVRIHDIINRKHMCWTERVAVS